MPNEHDELLADLLFAYVNKDDESPHTFELEAVKNAVDYLLKNYRGRKYTKDFFLRVLEEIEHEVGGENHDSQ